MRRSRWAQYAVAVPPAMVAGLAAGTSCGGAAFTTNEAPPETDGGIAEAGSPASDVAVQDTSSADQGAPEAAGSWCSMQLGHLFCEDFDIFALPSQFGKESVTGGGTLSYDELDFRSPPHSLLAATPPATVTATSSSAVLTRMFVHDGTRFQFQAAFEVGAECLVGTDSVAPVALYFSNYALILVANAAKGATLLELGIGPDGGANGSALHPLTAALLTGRWISLILDAQLGVAQKVTLTIDGTPVLAGEKLTLLPSPAPMHPTLVVGASVTSTPGVTAKGCTVHADNVTFDVATL